MDIGPVFNEHQSMSTFQSDMNKPSYSISYMGVKDGKFGILTKRRKLLKNPLPKKTEVKVPLLRIKQLKVQKPIVPQRATHTPPLKPVAKKLPKPKIKVVKKKGPPPLKEVKEKLVIDMSQSSRFDPPAKIGKPDEDE